MYNVICHLKTFVCLFICSDVFILFSFFVLFVSFFGGGRIVKVQINF